jgi:NhaP-type Na+/H+ or K+/H+ antiporter
MVLAGAVLIGLAIGWLLGWLLDGGAAQTWFED